MRKTRLLALLTAAALAVTVTACSSSSDDTTAGPSGEGFPITVSHALGSTTIESADRIATVGWSNQEVPLALGVVPVGMAKATWGDDNNNGVLPWVEDKLKELGAETPTMYDETDGPDFEAVAATEPDVILAAYSGITKDQYDKLSKIAPVVAYPKIPWGTTWEETIALNSKAMGREGDGQKLIADLTAQVNAAVSAHPQLKTTKTMFAYLEPTDLSKIGYYTLNDPRAEFLKTAGLPVPSVVERSSSETDKFYVDVSAEQADQFNDVGLIITYGDDSTLARLQADPLLGKIPAIKAGHVAILRDSTPLAAASNPSPLSIPWGAAKYFDLMAASLK
ncbi:iron-siderophore ABC transporter substrate-binding protein [Gordonia sp. (in: high G+C Gram-positive bacteria)]|uniref:iron-siderophore ABC transporter substrate-binding protein n=1 Tax=Gordonia sp. (in: high G+C Gram-positive bacteria) TaxID=84139 RepID=UPI003340B6B4